MKQFLKITKMILIIFFLNFAITNCNPIPSTCSLENVIPFNITMLQGKWYDIAHSKYMYKENTWKNGQAFINVDHKLFKLEITYFGLNSSNDCNSAPILKADIGSDQTFASFKYHDSNGWLEILHKSDKFLIVALCYDGIKTMNINCQLNKLDLLIWSKERLVSFSEKDHNEIMLLMNEFCVNDQNDLLFNDLNKENIVECFPNEIDSILIAEIDINKNDLVSSIDSNKTLNQINLNIRESDLSTDNRENITQPIVVNFRQLNKLSFNESLHSNNSNSANIKAVSSSDDLTITEIDSTTISTSPSEGHRFSAIDTEENSGDAEINVSNLSENTEILSIVDLEVKLKKSEKNLPIDLNITTNRNFTDTKVEVKYVSKDQTESTEASIESTSFSSEIANNIEGERHNETITTEDIFETTTEIIKTTQILDSTEETKDQFLLEDTSDTDKQIETVLEVTSTQVITAAVNQEKTNELDEENVETNDEEKITESVEVEEINKLIHEIEKVDEDDELEKNKPNFKSTEDNNEKSDELDEKEMTVFKKEDKEEEKEDDEELENKTEEETTTISTTTPFPCQDVNCQVTFCKFGRKKDENGCDMCDCLTNPNSTINECIHPYCHPCFYGSYTDENGCDSCACKPRPKPKSIYECPKLECASCNYGSIKDEYGCETCICIRPNSLERSYQCPPEPTCPFGPCKHGSVLNDYGCNTCDCLKSTEVQKEQCVRQRCSTPCPNGYFTDADGCETCSCKPDWMAPCALANTNCEETCEFGSYLDRNGCPSCECLPNPNLKTKCAEIKELSDYTECDSYGKFMAKQCNEEECQCVTKDGIPIADFKVNKSESEGMNCECALALYEISVYKAVGFKLYCAANGNYEIIQCVGGSCACVNEHGDPLGPSVPIYQKHLLRCEGVFQRVYYEQYLTTIPPTTLIPPLCVFHREKALEMGSIDLHLSIPECDEKGLYLPVQCDRQNKYCWCVNSHNGIELFGTRKVGERPDCSLIG